MPSTFRIPKAAISGSYAKILKSYAQLASAANMRSRFNSAAGLQSQGFSEVCELPLAEPGQASRPAVRSVG
jgi:hypothetical protein